MMYIGISTGTIAIDIEINMTAIEMAILILAVIFFFFFKSDFIVLMCEHYKTVLNCMK